MKREKQREEGEEKGVRKTKMRESQNKIMIFSFTICE